MVHMHTLGMIGRWGPASLGIFVFAVSWSPAPAAEEPAGPTVELIAQSRDRESGALRIRPVRWPARGTAVIICDLWDAHHSFNATRRVEELAPRIEAFVTEARSRGAFIIHAPSDCMAAYEGHPARERATAAPVADDLPKEIGSWCHWKDEDEEATGYPIDHSDGGVDDTPEDAAAWAKKLTERGRDPGRPWVRQTEVVTIDPDRDAVTDRGEEVWNLLRARDIGHVMLVGVHTNMCVLGRPFGLRQLSRHGLDVVLVRDLTDTMYNPAMRPFVSHFRGTDLVVRHIERHVCPTVSSEQLLGGAPFVFPGDERPQLVGVIGEREYETATTLPAFAEEHLEDAFRLRWVFADPDDGNRFPGIAVLDHADLLVLSVRRRTPPDADLAAVRRFVGRGGPVIGVRTASHAFALRDAAPPEGHDAWPEFDADVLGGSYDGHHGNELKTRAWIPENAPADHPILAGLPPGTEWATGGSLYRNTPLQAGATVLAMGRAESVEQAEPVAWTHASPAGGRVFYTSLGHPDDFAGNPFVRLLADACLWAAGVEAKR